MFVRVLQGSIKLAGDTIMLGTNETLASKHDIAKGQTRPLNFSLLNLSSFITTKGVKKHNI